MTWRVSIRAAAVADLHEAQEWYEGQSPGLGGEFLLCVADALTRLEQSPERFPLYYRGFRRVLTRRFPYKLFYRIQGDAIIVFVMRASVSCVTPASSGACRSITPTLNSSYPSFRTLT